MPKTISNYHLIAFDTSKKFVSGAGQAFGLRDEGEGGGVVLGEECFGEELQPVGGILDVGPAVLFYLRAKFCMVN